MNHWREMKTYVGWSETDALRLAALWPLVSPHKQAIVDRFYASVVENKTTHSILSHEAQVERLKITLKRWLRQMLTGPHDQAYYEGRQRIGQQHVKVALPQRFMFTGMSLIKDALIDIVSTQLAGEDARQTLLAVNRVTTLELAIVTESFQTAHETQEMQELQELLVENLPVLVLLLNEDQEVTASTKQWLGLFSRAAIIGDSVQDLLHPDCSAGEQILKSLKEATNSRVPQHLSKLVTDSGSGQKFFQVTITPLDHRLAKVLLYVEEYTQTVRREEQIQQSKSLTRIGRMSASVAHEVRNPLTAISATLQVLDKSLTEDDQRRNIIAKVLTQVDRLDRLVTDLLGYSRPTQLRCRSLSVAAIARDAIASSGTSAELSVEKDLVAWLDGNNLHNVLVNLLLNAREEVGEQGRVLIRIRADRRIDVVDDGPGIDPDVRGTLFEPFVTTKAQGTGLGLAICQKIMASMDGGLDVSRMPDPELGGAHFRVYLPAESELPT